MTCPHAYPDNDGDLWCAKHWGRTCQRCRSRIVKLYVRSTGDRLDLPLAVADSAEELARMLGTTKGSVMSSISHGHKGWERVEVEVSDAEMYQMRRAI